MVSSHHRAAASIMLRQSQVWGYTPIYGHQRGTPGGKEHCTNWGDARRKKAAAKTWQSYLDGRNSGEGDGKGMYDLLQAELVSNMATPSHACPQHKRTRINVVLFQHPMSLNA